MAALPYMQLYVAEYLADTQHLTGPQHGAYMLLMMNYWTRGKALPDTDSRLAVIARTEMADWTEKVRPALEEFFVIGEGKWSHNRIDRDLAAVNMKCEQAKSNRSKRKHEHGTTPVPTPVPTAVVPREEKRREESTGTSTKPFASTADAVPAERGKLIGRMPLPGKAGEYEIFEQDADGWQQTYPGVDVRQELRECKQWLVDNPNLRKTAKGMRRFINSWMAREQDKGGRNGISGGNQQANRVSGAVQRQSESDDGFRNIAQRRYGVPAANEANAGSVHKPNYHRGNGGDVPGAVGGDGDGVRDAGFHGRTIEGHPG